MRALHINIRVIIVFIWMITAGFYIRYEAYPVWFTRTLPGYRGLLPDELLTRESWKIIRINEQPAGYVHTIFTMDDDAPDPVLEITTRMQMRVSILQSVQTINVFSEIFLDQDYLPQRFTLSTSAGDFALRVQGEHTGDRQFTVTTTSGTSTTTRIITLPRDIVFYSPVYELAIQQLRPGRSLSIRTLDPLTLQTTTLMVTAGTREMIELDGRQVRALPLETHWQGLILRSWINDAGLVLRQETPFGWTMETAQPEQAVEAVSNTQPAPPLLPGVAGISLLQTLIGARTTQERP